MNKNIFSTNFLATKSCPIFCSDLIIRLLLRLRSPPSCRPGLQTAGPDVVARLDRLVAVAAQIRRDRL